MFFDAHMHIGGIFGAFTTRMCGEYLDSFMDSVGLSYGFVTSMSSSLNHNLYVISEVSKFPNRLFGFYWVNPNRTTILDEVSKALENGFIGIKFRPETDGYSMFNISLLESILDYACREKLLVYIHCSGFGSSHPRAIRHVCSLYPELKIIIGHMAQGSIEAIKIAEEYDNVFLETSVYRDKKFIEYAVNKLGSNRILFGSDYPYSNVQMEISKILNLNIPHEDKLKILFFNSLSLLPSKYSPNKSLNSHN
ncbi:MAG: amidohydrolase family protein [Candidatus Methanomethylicia archaeon]